MILRNAAKCNDCGDVIVSLYVHDFAAHYCKVNPRPATKWEGDKIVPDEGKFTYSFAVDGGKDYIRRVGEGFTDVSEYQD